ncbi:MAG TPA: single-stranded-DNA-specific exonuclease RecJ [Baekduia sp.]|uniref:single-stranded-DNA-specific exonuclease RecJ n=1 Tax=Baekduia sp. TaxID=2600305 RepID=UPI002D771BCE|nr:single-stranded-DNA-specific exonuclease RecJ [Baekduia sp.]HET6507411.1 single-stranded-DNA-specific exonuclease RecJ [Baekduia sp.]
MLTPRLDVPPCDSAAALSLARDLGMSFPVAQVLVRRGIATLEDARAWLAGADEHGADAFGPALDEAIAVLLRHAEAKTRITVHGDYDVDGVTSTAILVRALRAVGADVDWYLPSRSEDGYGLSAATVEKLAARGTKLLVTTDCGITAVDEVALAKSLGLDVVVTDHHQPRADGRVPDAPIVHPSHCGYPCPDLCAGGVAHKVAGALLQAAGHDASIALADLDLVALATIADCVPLVGENRRLVRSGLLAIGRTEKVGLRALMRVAKVDPSRVQGHDVGFKLAPRINAAGRLHRADAALELLLTHDEERAKQIAEELDRANADRRFVEERIRFEAEAQVAELGDQPAYVLWGEGWHAGVIGIVASRIAERHHRPVVMIALREGEAEGTGSGRSIPAFDLLGGLEAASAHLLRHGGHRAAAGCTIARGSLDAFRAAFVAHAGSALSAEDLVPLERVDAVVSGDELGTSLAEELGRLAPFGIGNPTVSLLVPAARLVDAHPMSDGKHVRFTVEAGGIRARAVAFNVSRLPDGAADGRLHATFTLELNEWQGTIEPRLVLRKLLPAEAEAPALVGEPAPATAEWEAEVRALATAPALALAGAAGAAGAAHAAVTAELDGLALADPASTLDGLHARAARGGGRTPRDRRATGLAGTIAALVHTGEPVLVLAADGPARARQLTGRLGGFAIASWDAVERNPSLADGYHHLVALDPPLHPAQEALLVTGHPAQMAHLAWGEPELRYSRDVLERDHDLRPGLVAAYRALRDGRPAADALGHRPVVAAGRLLAVLVELGLVTVGDDGQVALVPDVAPTDLERSLAYRHAKRRHAEGTAWLTSASGTRQAA